jgi:hypothetical protein
LSITKSDISFNTKNKFKNEYLSHQNDFKPYRSPIITVRFGSTSGNAKRIASNIAACGLPSIVGVRPEAVATDARIEPAPKLINQIYDVLSKY